MQNVENSERSILFADKIKNDLHSIFSTLVDNPNIIQYKVVNLETRLILQVFAYDQTRFILGKQGSTITSIRNLLKTIIKKHNINGSPFSRIDIDVQYTNK